MQLTQEGRAMICRFQLLARGTERALHPGVVIEAKAEVGKPMRHHVSNGKRRGNAPRKTVRIPIQGVGIRVPTPRVKGKEKDRKVERRKEKGGHARRAHELVVILAAILVPTGPPVRWISPKFLVGSTRMGSAEKATVASTSMKMLLRP